MTPYVLQYTATIHRVLVCKVRQDLFSPTAFFVFGLEELHPKDQIGAKIGAANHILL